MGSTRDFITSTLADAMLPALRRPVEDVVYETLDQRQVPTRTDFRELRDVVNELRGQVSQATSHTHEDTTSTQLEALERQVQALGARLDTIESTLQAHLDALKPASAPAAEAPSAEKPAAAAPAEKPAHKLCKVPGCEDRARARGFCPRHYARWKRGTLDGFPNPDA